MADTAIKKKKLEIMEFPKISSTTSIQYDNLKKENKKERITTPAPSNIPDSKEVAEKIEKVKARVKVFGFNISKIKLAIFYVAVLTIAAFSKIWVLYNVSNLGVQKKESEAELASLKAEVEELENTYISNYDLKQVEKKAKKMGFIPKENIEFINID